MTTNHDDLLKKLAKVAPPLPWAQKYNGLGVYRKTGDARALRNLVVPPRYNTGEAHELERARRNYAYIVAACNAVPSLIDENRRLQKALELRQGAHYSANVDLEATHGLEEALHDH